MENVPDRELDYLCVDRYLPTLVDAGALASAFELGIVDFLLGNQPATLESILGRFKGDAWGLELLLGMLRRGGVVEGDDDRIRLTAGFIRALHYRDILEVKLGFGNFAAHDFIDFFTLLVKDAGEFMRRARTFRLFDYGRCADASPENLNRARQWMRVTTVFTKYEARVCMACHDFGRYRRMMDIGGNSGEFALQICMANPGIEASVFDLPVVCDVGQEYLGRRPEASRVTFLRGDALADTLPGGHDLVTFKSFLHDWPERQAVEFLDRAAEALEPGGTLLVFERGPLDLSGKPVAFSMIPLLMFARHFRPPSLYKDRMEALCLEDVNVKWVGLETPFFLVTGVKPS